jgi:hypothetical protein
MLRSNHLKGLGDARTAGPKMTHAIDEAGS